MEDSRRIKVIVDTDPGVDDAITLITALLCKEVDVIGVTTIFGNVPTVKATSNALDLLEFLGRGDIPVAKGSDCTFTGEAKLRIADFVHGDDGLGNTDSLPPAKAKAIDLSASQFIIETAYKHPGEVVVLALGPLTNLALALKEDPKLGDALHSIVCLGGAFRVNGNVSPASEANIFCDPDAADLVFGSSVKMSVVPLDVTQRCLFSNMDLDLFEAQGGKIGKYIKDISQFYANFHKTTYNVNGLMLHDPIAFIAIVRPDLFFWKKGPIRVCCEGLLKGMTVLDENKKNWRGENAWSGREHMSVALEIDERVAVDAVRKIILNGTANQ